MEGVDVPSYFLCPISLEIMRDPVTLPTGITYDRESIERWIFSGKHQTCPVTKQPLSDALDLTPNHTLRRLIQAWCAANAASGVERFPTPRPPVSPAQIAALLEEAKRPATQLAALRKLKAVVAESERNRRCVEASSGTVDVLASIVEKGMSNSTINLELKELLCDAMEPTGSAAEEEAMSILCSLQLSEKSLLGLIQRDVDFVGLLTKGLGRSSHALPTYSLLLLKSLLPVIAPGRVLLLSQEFFGEVTKVLRDQISNQATKAALQVLCVVSPWGGNRQKAVEAGAVWVLVELLMEEQERRASEMMLVILEQLCRCAEGRAELVGHAAGIAVAAKKIHRVSQLATKVAVKILYAVAMHSAGAGRGTVREMVESGGVSKMCVVLQTECEEKVKEKIREMLKVHSAAWRNSPCLASRFKATYHSLSL